MEFGGLYHTWKKHDDLILAAIIPPLSWYRAVEAFWHNDFAGVNWGIRLKEDAKACVYFLKASTEQTTDPHELNNGIEKFSKEIRAYPKDKLDTLKTHSKTFATLYMTLFGDFENAVKQYFISGQSGLSHSGEIVRLEAESKQYLPDDYYKQMIQEIELAYSQFEQSLNQTNSFTDEQKKLYMQTIVTGRNYADSNMNSTYNKIFPEK